MDAVATGHIRERVQKHRNTRRSAGLRLVQLWVPDTRRPDFAAECRRQSARVANADQRDPSLAPLLHEALGEVDGWTA